MKNLTDNEMVFIIILFQNNIYDFQKS